MNRINEKSINKAKNIANNNNINILNIEDIIDSSSEVEYMCNICLCNGKMKLCDFNRTKRKIIYCKKCYATSNLQKKINDKFGDNSFLLLDKISNNRENVKIKCLKCNDVFISNCDLLMRKNIKSPHKCYNKNAITNSDFYKMLLDKYGSNTHTIINNNDSDIYSRSTSVKIKCNSCGYEFNATYNDMKNQKSKKNIYCARCNSVEKKSSEYYKMMINELDKNIIILSEDKINFNSKIKVKCNSCGKISIRFVSNILNGAKCKYCCGNGTSKYEKEIFEFLKENCNKKIIYHDRKLLENGQEIDFLIPDLNLAIEFNGLFYHSSDFKEKNYHINKKIKCSEKNITLIQIYESDWIYNKNCVKNKILSYFNIKKYDNIKTSTDENSIVTFIKNNSLCNVIKNDKYLCVEENKNIIAGIIYYYNGDDIIIKDYFGVYRDYILDFIIECLNTRNITYVMNNNYPLTNSIKISNILNFSNLLDPDYFYTKDQKIIDKNVVNNICLTKNYSIEEFIKNNRYKKVYDSGKTIYKTSHNLF